jgi:hypothetical protein
MTSPTPVRRRLPGLVAILSVAWLARASPVNADGIDPFRAEPIWQPLFHGIEHVELAVAQPRPMRGHAVRIDLRRQGIRFLATPGNGDRPGETDGLKTSTFLARHGCQLAINAAPFSPVQELEEAGLDVVGLHVSRGEVVSPADRERPALLIDRDNRVTISRAPRRTGGVETAVSGFHIVLEKGEVVRGAFEDVRGQPEAVRFSADGVSWGPWRDFAAEVTEADVAAPLQLQLRSRLGVLAEPVSLGEP